jgi:hypothetical protein
MVPSKSLATRIFALEARSDRAASSSGVNVECIEFMAGWFTVAGKLYYGQ